MRSIRRPKPQQLRRWATNAFIAIAFVAGASFGIEPAGNIAIFALWVMLPLGMLAIGLLLFTYHMASSVLKRSEDPEGIRVSLNAFNSISKVCDDRNRALDTLYDVSLVLYLAAVGWFITAVAAVLTLIVSQLAFEISKRARGKVERHTEEALAALFSTL